MQPTTFQKIAHFFLTKIVIGIAVIVGLVVLIEWSGRSLLDKTQLPDDIKNVIIAVAHSVVAVAGYRLLFGKLEKRQVEELNVSKFGKYAVTGFLTGLLLQSLFIAVIYLAGTYSIVGVNSVSSLILPFATALTAGFVAEILLIGVGFRLIEEKLGTNITVFVFILFFAVLHINAKGATFLSVCATAVQAGFMLSAAYVCSRSLWLPIFLHFGWDFAEPGIFGGVNPGISITQSLFTSRIEGAALVTGGDTGPQNSIQALIFCLLTGGLFLWLAMRRNNFIKPFWKN